MAKATSTDTSTPRQTRPRKSAAEKAQIEFEKATKRATTAGERVTQAQTAVQDAVAEQEAAQRFLDYVSRNPDLPQQDVPGEAPVEDGADQNAVTQPA